MKRFKLLTVESPPWAPMGWDSLVMTEHQFKQYQGYFPDWQPRVLCESWSDDPSSPFWDETQDGMGDQLLCR